jgi:hypothetical protein
MITMTMTAPVNESAAPTLSTSRFRTLLVLPSANTPSVHIISMQDSNSATTTRAGGGVHREPMTNRATTMRASRIVVPVLLLPILLLPCQAFLSSVTVQDAKGSVKFRPHLNLSDGLSY